MKIKLDERFTITSDELNVVLNIDRGMKTDKDGKEFHSLEAVGFYNDIEGAINGYIRKKSNASEATSINQLINEIRDLRKHVHELVTAK